MFSNDGCYAVVNDGGEGRSIDHTSSCLFVAFVNLTGDNVVVPLVEGWIGGAGVAVSLAISGRAHLLDFGAYIHKSLVGDVRLYLLVGKQFICCLQTFILIIDLAGSLGGALLGNRV